MCYDDANEYTSFRVVHNDGTGGDRLYPTRQHAECAREFYDYEYPLLGPHAVVEMREVRRAA